MMDWRGREDVFRTGQLSPGELLDLTEPHFTFRRLPMPEQLWAPLNSALKREGGDSFLVMYKPGILGPPKPREENRRVET